MKRIWLALALLLTVAGLCTAGGVYVHRQTDILLGYLDELEDSYLRGDTAETLRWARRLAEEYEQRTASMDCFIAHSDLEDSRETAVMLPAVVEQEGWEELRMEAARLREQLEHLQSLDKPTLRNVL